MVDIEKKEELAKALLAITLEALKEIIEFLEIDAALQSLTSDDIRSIRLMRDGVVAGDRYFFGGSKTMGRNVAAALQACRDLGLEASLEILRDTLDDLKKSQD